MIFQKESLWIQNWWILSKKQSLDFDKLDVCILVWIIAELWWPSIFIIIVFVSSFRFSTCRLSLNISISTVQPTAIIAHDRRWRLTACWNCSWWKSHALSEAQIISTTCRLWLGCMGLWWLCCCIDLQWVGWWSTFCFWRALSLLWWMLLSDSHKLSISSLTTHDVSSWRENALYLSSLTSMTSHAPVSMDLSVIVLLDLILWVTWHIFIVLVSDSLTSSTEETFHAIQISRCNLMTLLLLLMVLLNFCMRILNSRGIVLETVSMRRGLLPSLLNLRLEGFINTLTLWKRMIQSFWAVDGLHCHIWTQRHTLMNMTSRRQWICPVLFTICPSWSMVNAERIVLDWVLWRLHHRRKLKLLIVKIIRLLTSVSFTSMSRKLFIQVNSRRTIHVVAKGTSLWRHSNR